MAMIATTIIPAILPVDNPFPVRASFSPTGGTTDSLTGFVGGGISVATENTTCEGNVVGFVVKGSVEGISVVFGEAVVWSVNECSG